MQRLTDPEIAEESVVTTRGAAVLSLHPTEDETGAAAVEYGVVCGAAVGIGGILWKLLTSSYGQAFIKAIFNAVKGLLPF